MDTSTRLLLNKIHKYIKTNDCSFIKTIIDKYNLTCTNPVLCDKTDFTYTYLKKKCYMIMLINVFDNNDITDNIKNEFETYII